MNRRDILRAGAVATASAAKFVRAGTVFGDDVSDPSEALRRVIKIGLVGCGGRGTWISRLFHQHGGFQIHGGDSPDATSVVYDYDGGLLHEHFGQALPNRIPGELSCTFHMHGAHALVSYWGNAAYEIRGQKRVEKPVSDLYEAGAKRNIAAFHNAICEEQYDNTTVPRAVDGCLTCILGREAAAQRQRVTMDTLLAAQTRIEVDLSGLKP